MVMRSLRSTAFITAMICVLATASTSDASTALGSNSRSGARRSKARRTTAFSVRSSSFVDGGTMPIRFTCDGGATTPSLVWTGGPAGTKSYAVVMHHVASPGDIHWYWVIFGIGADVTHLDEGAAPPAGVILGTNSINGRNEYAPPCSKGPGAKQYTLTVYALSKTPNFPPGSAVNRELLLAAVSTVTLGSSAITVSYSR
jgi:phosphatidylethanolamine-binding protein (PEBP) family uncharacterized protein